MSSARTAGAGAAWASVILAAIQGCGGRTSIVAADYEFAGGSSGIGSGGTAGTNGSGAGPGRPTGAGGTTGGGGVGGKGGGVPGGSGGTGGTATPGGTGGANGGQGGIAVSGSGGTGGSPEVLAACEQACQSQPPACVGSQSAPCDFSCQQIASQFPGCEPEITDYFDCLSGALDPAARCMLAGNGDCYGAHCTTAATDACADVLQIFNSCQAGSH